MNLPREKSRLFQAVLSVKGGDVLLPPNQFSVVEPMVGGIKKANGALSGAGAGLQADGIGSETGRDGERVSAFHGIAFFVLWIGFSVAQMGRLGNWLDVFGERMGLFCPMSNKRRDFS